MKPYAVRKRTLTTIRILLTAAKKIVCKKVKRQGGETSPLFSVEKQEFRV
jgi:hypothetical protein